ncbi:MAG: hypothetical protein IJS01_13640 [Lentisphaeria bacterium]|nr:hypothetical protein [Lentisphaeria bacterium]
MRRIPFSQVLKNSKVDINREYKRLYKLFYSRQIVSDCEEGVNLSNLCADCFMKLPFRGTCVSINDFNDFHGYRFRESPKDFNIDYLISFCEYSYNLVNCSGGISRYSLTPDMHQVILFYLTQVKKVIETVGYMENIQNGITDFVPKDQCAISVAEIVDPSLSYKVIEYHHHSMKGDWVRKRETLVALVDKLEPQRAKLRQINTSLETDLFFLFNNVNLRHNNADSNGKNYKLFVAKMAESEIEKWYDDTYQMCLLAFLELEHLDRKPRIGQLKTDIQNNA